MYVCTVCMCVHVSVNVCVCVCMIQSHQCRGGPPGLGGATHYQTQGLGAREVPELVSQHDVMVGVVM